MDYKKFFYKLIYTILIILILITSVNYYFDFYAVLSQNKNIYYESINDRYAKMKYVLNNPNKYDIYIWGSSRIQKADPNILGKRAYNMGASAGSPEDCLHDLRILIKNKVNIKKVYLALDNFSYKNNHEYDLTSFNRIPYNENLFADLDYLSKVLFKEIDFHKIKGYIGLTDYRLEKTYLKTTGHLEVPEYVEKKIDDNAEEYVEDRKFLVASSADDVNEHISKTVSIIKEISKLCYDNNIEFEFFFNPVHITSYLEDDIENSNKFKKEIVKINNFYDFNNINFISKNNIFWYETSHPRALICNLILCKVSGNILYNIPEDFGVYITKENIDDYCKKYKNDREKFTSNYVQFISNDIKSLFIKS